MALNDSLITSQDSHLFPSPSQESFVCLNNLKTGGAKSLGELVGVLKPVKSGDIGFSRSPLPSHLFLVRPSPPF